MSDGDHPTTTKSDLIGWTPQMVFWNTLGTIIGGVSGVAALAIAVVALLK